MLAYIFRRLLLIIPTLFGILLINFIIIQAAPGGPVEQMIAKLEGFEGATSRIAGGGAEVAIAGSNYRGAQGLDPELIAEIERLYGFDKPAPERFWIMLKNYARFDFGESFFRDAKVIDLIIEKMPVSISLGLWRTLIMYLVSIQLADDLVHRAAGGGLDDDEVDQQDAEQRGNDQQQATEDIRQHLIAPCSPLLCCPRRVPVAGEPTRCSGRCRIWG